MKSKPISTIVIITMLAMLVSCSAGRGDTTFAPPPSISKEQVWQLTEVMGKAVGRTSEAVTLTFNPQTVTLKGKAYCNTYSADYRMGVEDGRLSDGQSLYTFSVSSVGSTSVQCPDVEMNALSRYLSLLAKATHIGINATSTAMVIYQKGKPLLNFELL